MRRLAFPLTVILVLGGPGAALGAVIEPPGKSGANQYFEDIPTASGPAAPPSYGPGASSAPSAIRSLGRGAAGVRALSHLGGEGAAAAALAQATAPTPATAGSSPTGTAAAGGKGRGSGGRAAPVVKPALPVAQAASPASAISHALGGAGGLGALLPVLLLASLVGAIILGLWRLRRGSGPAAQSL